MRFRVVFVLAVLLLLYATCSFSAQKTPSDLALPIEGMVTMIDFGAETCIPCKMMKPILEELHKEYKGKAAIVYVDIRGRSNIARKYRLRGIPTQVFFDVSGKEVYRHVGFLDKTSIEKQLKEMGVRK